jgi:hypothetical protein
MTSGSPALASCHVNVMSTCLVDFSAYRNKATDRVPSTQNAGKSSSMHVNETTQANVEWGFVVLTDRHPLMNNSINSNENFYGVSNLHGKGQIANTVCGNPSNLCPFDRCDYGVVMTMRR